MALVTGANKGIGKEIAKGLAQRGFKVQLGARNVLLGKEAAAELAEYGSVTFQQLDINDISSITAAAAKIQSTFGHLDVLVCSFLSSIQHQADFSRIQQHCRH